MTINFVSRKEVIDNLLDLMNDGVELDSEQMQMLKDFSK